MKQLIFPVVLSALGLGLAGCEKEGPMERAGEKMDQAVEDVKEGAESMTEKDSGTIDEISVEGKKDKPEG